MKNLIISVSLIVVSTTALWFYFQNEIKKNKIGYVKSGVVLQEYKGMKEANDGFSKEMVVVQTNLDTLKARYESIQRILETNPPNKKDLIYQADVTKGEFDKYSEQAYEQMEARKQELSQTVLSDINKYIQEYGKTSGYKLILGTTNDGSVLYGDEKDDLTEIIVKKLNEEYEKKQKK